MYPLNRIVGETLRLLDNLLVVKQTLYALSTLFQREQTDLDPQCLEYTHINHNISISGRRNKIGE